MKKVTYPPYLMLVATILATFANKVFHVTIDLNLAAGALAVVANYLVAQFAVDIRAIKAGQIPTGSFNSVKLITTLTTCLALGITRYCGIELSTEVIFTWAGIAATIVTGKAITDIQQQKKEAKPVDDDIPYTAGDNR